jgi:sulfur-oxidizing protein SoxY
MNEPRRIFLKNALAIGGAMILPPAVMAEWPAAFKQAFQAKTVEDALKHLFDDPQTTSSDQILIQAPAIAENGAIVPIEVTANLPQVESITILVTKNPMPLVGQFKFASHAKGYIKTRIKMMDSSSIVAVVKAAGKLHIARREIEVSEGACQ